MGRGISSVSPSSSPRSLLTNGIGTGSIVSQKSVALHLDVLLVVLNTGLSLLVASLNVSLKFLELGSSGLKETAGSVTLSGSGTGSFG